MGIRKLGHYAIRTNDLDASHQFYTTVLGFKEGYRPPFTFPGFWLYLGEGTGDDEADYGTVHLIGTANDKQGLTDYLGEAAPNGQKSTGAIDHIAFVATGLAEMRSKLQSLDMPFRERTVPVPVLGLHQIFVSDPNNVTIELNYPAAEAQALGLA